MIEVSHLSKSYRDLKAVDDVSFQVQSGEILGFLGPNGAGKTTTMRILTGVLPPTSGTVKVAGFDVFEQPLEVKKRIGYLPENPPVYTDMTVRAYLRFVASIKGVSRKARDGEVDRVAQKTNCTQFIQRAACSLGRQGGENGHGQCNAEDSQWKLDQPHAVKEIRRPSAKE